MKTPYNLNRPKGLADYCTEIAEKKYIIYGNKRAYCTHCKKHFEYRRWMHFDHNIKTYCPECNQYVILKNKRYGRKNITEYGRILWMQKRKSITYLQLDEYIIDYSQGMVPVVHFWPSAQYKFSAKEQHYYKHIPEGYREPEQWVERKSIKLPAAAIGMTYGWQTPTYQKTDIYPYTTNETGTDLKYANTSKYRNPYELTQYIHLFLKWQSIELLEKAGYEKIVKQKTEGRTTSVINWRGKNLKSILKCSNKELKDIKRLDFGMTEISGYRDLKKLLPWLEMDEYWNAKMVVGYTLHVDVPKLSDPEKTIRYLMDQRDNFDRHVTLSDYIDYIKECKKLGYDLDRKNIRFPKSLMKAHHETSNKVEMILNKEKEDAFVKTQLSITDMTKPFAFGKYLIRPAKNPQELMKESEVLKHCVRTYVDKVARGKASILFIRDTKKPDEPLYTLELSPKKKIVQCRGKHNCSYPEEVARFIEEWEIQVLKTKKRSKKGVAA